MTKEIEQAEKLKAELDSFRPLDAEKEARVMQKFRLDWNYHSNHLEGTQLTYGETKALLLFGITAQGKPLKDHLEITGHNEAIELVTEVIKDERPLTESFIRELHTLLLKEPYYVDAVTPNGQPTKRLIEIGKYKSHPNHVLTQTGETFYFATPEETPSRMSDLIDWYRAEKNNINPIILAAEFHYKFIRIHPFDDGNGRLARILMNFILMQFGYPPVIIKTEDKQNYLSVLQQADAGILEPFITYIANNLLHSLEIMIRGAKGESIEEPDDFNKELALLKQKVKNVGKRVDILRSKENILNIFENSIEPLIFRFVDLCQKFDDFYLKSELMVFFNGSGIHQKTVNELISGIKSRIDSSDTNYSIKPFYLYTNFRQTGFNDFNYESQICIKFELSKYTIDLDNKSDFYEKLYSEQLDESEISKIVKIKAESHKKFIEQKVEEINVSQEKSVFEFLPFQQRIIDSEF